MQNIPSSPSSCSDIIESLHTLREEIERSFSAWKNYRRFYSYRTKLYSLILQIRKLPSTKSHPNIVVVLSEIQRLLTKLTGFSVSVIFKKIQMTVLKIKSILTESHKVQNIYPLSIKNTPEDTCLA